MYLLYTCLAVVCHSCTHNHQITIIIHREVWPEAEEFGGSGISVDEEMEVMRNILLNPVAGMSMSGWYEHVRFLLLV